MEGAGAVDANECQAFLRMLYVVYRLGREHDGLGELTAWLRIGRKTCQG